MPRKKRDTSQFRLGSGQAPFFDHAIIIDYRYVS